MNMIIYILIGIKHIHTSVIAHTLDAGPSTAKKEKKKKHGQEKLTKKIKTKINIL